MARVSKERKAGQGKVDQAMGWAKRGWLGRKEQGKEREGIDMGKKGKVRPLVRENNQEQTNSGKAGHDKG